MKAILIAFLLLASLIFLPTSTLARPERFQTNDPSKPACAPGWGYTNCLSPPAKKPRCSPYVRNC